MNTTLSASPSSARRAATIVVFVILAAATLAIFTATAFGQDAPRPPQAQTPGKTPLIFFYAAALLLTGAAIAAAVFPSKRSHLD